MLRPKPHGAIAVGPLLGDSPKQQGMSITRASDITRVVGGKRFVWFARRDMSWRHLTSVQKALDSIRIERHPAAPFCSGFRHVRRPRSTDDRFPRMARGRTAQICRCHGCLANVVSKADGVGGRDRCRADFPRPSQRPTHPHRTDPARSGVARRASKVRITILDDDVAPGRRHAGPHADWYMPKRLTTRHQTESATCCWHPSSLVRARGAGTNLVQFS
jgi:hypothetical protein